MSSTSIFTKMASRDPYERRAAEEFIRTEESLRRACDAKGLTWTILRPTMIYGGGLDRNVSAIAAFIERFSFFPVTWPARGLRQPVHADDVAAAVLAAVGNPRAFGAAINLPGGETLPYREMVRRIFAVLGHRPIILPLPFSLLMPLFRLAREMRLTGKSPEFLRRMNQNLTVDAAEATDILNLSPRPFRPDFENGRKGVTVF